MTHSMEKALSIMSKRPDEWISPKRFGLHHRSFEALLKRALCEKRLSDRSQSVEYRII